MSSDKGGSDFGCDEEGHKDLANQIFEGFKNYRESRIICCSAQCGSRLELSELNEHAENLAYFKGKGHSQLEAYLRTLVLMNRQWKKRTSSYFIPGITAKLCRKTAYVLYWVDPDTITRWMRVPRPVPSTHGLTGRESNHARKEERTRVVDFVLQLADAEGLPMVSASRFNLEAEQPGCPPIRLLPPYLTIRGLHRMYKQKFLESGKEEPPPVFESFRKYFQDKRLSHVRLSRRTHGLCDYCLELRDSLRTLPERNVAEKMKEIEKHISDARKMRNQYRAAKADAIDGKIKCVSFDFAVQLKIPFFSHETSNQYHARRLGLDVNVFGIADEGTHRQHNFLWGEGGVHDTNAVISLFHHYVEQINTDCGRTPVLHLWTDSMSTQIRNRFVVWYLALRVLNGYHNEICLRFMIVGHTEGTCDQCFGHIRAREKKTDLLNLRDVKACVDSSSPHNVGVVAHVEWFKDWKTYLDSCKELRRFDGMKESPIVQINIKKVNRAKGKRGVKVAWTMVDGTVQVKGDVRKKRDEDVIASLDVAAVNDMPDITITSKRQDQLNDYAKRVPAQNRSFFNNYKERLWRDCYSDAEVSDASNDNGAPGPSLPPPVRQDPPSSSPQSAPRTRQRSQSAPRTRQRPQSAPR
eukprot:CAMPEP_0119123116 /NCGR_PEP_ID=MMETSP1310-20130426/3160_1 /TAXON_ID=464262 /ORGANISM="Genus nov. species nov., Strain RCC2339" /LENGTH=636 /DNA_ID=CAMNT_0007112865 /DNA_START=56 /DNA_END=1963 /DNA_ORIENTATION=-